MKIIYFSNGERGKICLQEILKEKFEVCAIVGIGHSEDLEKISHENDIPIFYPSKPNTEEFALELNKFSPDLFVCSGYNKILRPIIINIPKLGTINLHGGRLPFYRGAAPINWQIINGETVGGCAIIFMDAGIDTGPIIKQNLYNITVEDTHWTVLEKTLKIFKEMLIEVLNNFKKGIVDSEEQDVAVGNYYTRRYPEDSKINWQTMSDVQVHNLVRGMNGPYPAAYCFNNDEKIEINQTEICQENIHGVPGRVSLRRESGVLVHCSNRAILVKSVKIKDAISSNRVKLKIGTLLT